MINKIKELPEINVNGKDWIELKAWLLEELRSETDRIVKGKDLDFAQTNFYRGAYAAYEKVLKLEEKIIKKHQQA